MPFLGFRNGFLSLSLLCFGAFPCCKGSFEKTYETQTKGKTGQALYDSLLRLDQAYPDRLQLKIDLGARLLSSGENEGAKAYLDRGEKLLGLFVDSRSKYFLYADQAELKLRCGEFKEAIVYATKAFASSAEDSLGVVFTRAKAESALKDKDAALKDFDKGWAAQARSMSSEDYHAYAAALMESGRDADAIRLLGEYQKIYPYEQGIGLLESSCYEGIGDMGPAILSAFKEFEFRRPSGAISNKKLFDNLDAALKKSGAAGSESNEVLERLALSIKAFVKGDWNSATAIPLRGFGEYIALAAKLESGSASAAELGRYILLEPALKSFQTYYYHLWRGMKADARSYSTKAARPLLEKCVALAPASAMAKESRRELGRLIGIGESAGTKLLVPTEIDAIFAEVLAGAPLSRLEPVMALLDTPDNDYQLACMYTLGKFSSDPAMKAYVTARAKTAAGKMRERLTYILAM